MTEDSPRKLKSFGHYMSTLRKSAGLHQADIAHKAEELDLGDFRQDELPIAQIKKGKTTKNRFVAAFSQTAMNRLEQGETILPKPFFLKALAKIYNEDIENILAAHLGDLYFDSNNIADKNTEEKEEFFISNVTPIHSLEKIFNWERELVKNSIDKNHVTLWVVSPQFLDDHNANVLNMVVDNLLCHGCDITYFIGHGSTAPAKSFDVFLAKAARRVVHNYPNKNHLPKLGKISCYGLKDEELAWFTSSMVIGNPDDIVNGRDEPEGFVIASIPTEEGNLHPKFGIKMTEMYVRQVVLNLRERIFMRKREIAELVTAGRENGERRVSDSSTDTMLVWKEDALADILKETYNAV